MRVPLTVRDFLDRASLVYGERVGLVDEPDHPDGWGAITYRELARRARAFAAGLDALGILPGERVAIVSHNSARWIAALYGTCISGRILVPINFRLHAHEVEYIVRHSGARVLLLDAELDASLAERLVEHIRTRADEDVSSMKPFELARLWGAPRRDVLRTFLYATESGLTDLVWQVNCPVCRVGAKMADHLGDLADNQHCGACEIDYAIDFARHVEAVFPVSSGVRKVEPKLYCASSPAFLPHVFAQLRAGVGERVEHEADLPLGQILVRALWLKHSSELEHTTRPARLDVVVVPGGMRVSSEGVAAPTAPTRITLTNETDDEVAVLVERTSWSADAVLGTVVTSMPEFATLFATEAPASGVELRVGHIALLFSDLTGSTALYERVGDAKAFAIVEDHFRLMGGVIEKHGGGVIKTMGDAVMASFPTLLQAVEAGIEMVDAHDAKLGELGLGVKIGVHAGPCLAVRANDRLDYFGTTVNVAARLQAQAGPSQVVLTEHAAEEPAIATRLGGLARTRFEARLKGIKEEQRLLAVERPNR